MWLAGGCQQPGPNPVALGGESRNSVWLLHLRSGYRLPPSACCPPPSPALLWGRPGTTPVQSPCGSCNSLRFKHLCRNFCTLHFSSCIHRVLSSNRMVVSRPCPEGAWNGQRRHQLRRSLSRRLMALWSLERLGLGTFIVRCSRSAIAARQDWHTRRPPAAPGTSACRLLLYLNLIRFATQAVPGEEGYRDAFRIHSKLDACHTLRKVLASQVNAPDHRPRVIGVQYETEASSRGSVHPFR
jgi:hypothetical protein